MGPVRTEPTGYKADRPVSLGKWVRRHLPTGPRVLLSVKRFRKRQAVLPSRRRQDLQAIRSLGQDLFWRGQALRVDPARGLFAPVLGTQYAVLTCEQMERGLAINKQGRRLSDLTL